MFYESWRPKQDLWGIKAQMKVQEMFFFDIVAREGFGQEWVNLDLVFTSHFWKKVCYKKLSLEGFYQCKFVYLRDNLVSKLSVTGQIKFRKQTAFDVLRPFVHFVQFNQTSKVLRNC